MPYLRIQTNRNIDSEPGHRLMQRASRLVSEKLGKPERYVMVALQAPVPMLFAASDEPLAYAELKSIGLPVDATKELSAAVCGLLQDALEIPKERVYIEFSDAPRRMWGWNGATF